jgi:hypothetical protein
MGLAVFAELADKFIFVPAVSDRFVEGKVGVIAPLKADFRLVGHF